MKLERLYALREEKDWTQTYVAGRIKVSQRAYSHYENGTREIPLEILKQLALLYAVSTDYILQLTDVRKPYKH